MERKILFVIAIVLLVLTLTLTNSKQVDDVAVYSKNDKVISIKDNFGYGKEIGKAELKSHKTVNEIKQVPIGKDIPVMRYDVYGDLDIGEIEFKNLKTNSDTSRNYKLIKIDYVNRTIPITTYHCNNPNNKEDCSREVLRYETITEERRSLFNNNFNEGYTTIELVVDVYKGDYIDGIWSFNGVKATKHASWNASFETDLLAVWDFNNTGATMTERFRGHYNLTGSGTYFNNYSSSVLPNAINYSAGGNGLFSRSGNQDILGGSNGTMIIWIMPYTPQSSARNWWSTDDVNEYRLGIVSNSIQLTINGINVILDNSQTFFTPHQLMMVTATWDTHADIYKFYIDDTLKISSTTASSPAYDTGILFGILGIRPFEGLYIDAKLYNRTLSQGEISQHYNSGNGLSFVTTPQPFVQVTLTSPSDDSEFGSNSRIDFNSSFETNDYYNMTNATLRIFNGNSIIMTNFTTITGVVNTTSRSISNLTTGDYNWSYYACSGNTTDFICNQGLNRSFSVVALTINSESYNNITLGGQQEFYQINITTYGSNTISSANLIYNGTTYPASVTNPSTNNYSISRTITVPTVPASINKSFFWNIILSNGNVENTTIRNQTVEVLSIDNCTTNNFIIYNFTIKDEASQTKLNQDTFSTFGKVDLQLYNILNGSLVTNFSSNYTKTNPFYVCMNVNISSGQSYYIDTLVQYGASNYSSEFYNIVRDTLSSSTLDRRIDLYDLDSPSSTEFRITFRDNYYNRVPDALIILQRKYINEGVFKTVELPKTDSNGETTLHLKTGDVLYNIIVTKNGQILATFLNYVAKCQNAVLGECNIDLNQIQSTTSPTDFTNYRGLSFSFDLFNYTSRVSSADFIVIDGTASTITLNVTALYTNSSYTLLCQDSQFLSSGTVSCTIPSYFNGTAISKLYKDGYLVGQQIITNVGSQTNRQTYGTNLIFLSIFLILMFIGIGLNDNPLVLAFFLIVGAIVSLAFNFATNTGFIGYGATVLWIIIALITVMIKGARR